MHGTFREALDSVKGLLMTVVAAELREFLRQGVPLARAARGTLAAPVPIACKRRRGSAAGGGAEELCGILLNCPSK